MITQLVGTFGCLNILTVLQETAELAAQGQELAQGQTHLHKWHFPTLLEINGPENSQMLSTVLITASGIWIPAFIGVFQGFKRTASSPRANYIFTTLPFHCISAQSTHALTQEYSASQTGILPKQPGQQARLSMSFPLRARATCSTKCPTCCFQCFGLCLSSSSAGSRVVLPADHTSGANRQREWEQNSNSGVLKAQNSDSNVLSLSSMDTHYSHKETPPHHLPRLQCQCQWQQRNQYHVQFYHSFSVVTYIEHKSFVCIYVYNII